MILTAKYERKNFFGVYAYTEDVKTGATIDDLKKAFQAMKKDSNIAIQIDAKYTIAWDSLTDYENEVICVRTYTTWNSYSEEKRAFSVARRNILKEYAAE